jgi:uncharacterized protein YrrD
LICRRFIRTAGTAGTNVKETVMEKLDETTSLISASKVTGTNVYNPAGEHLGTVYDVMLDKRSGKIAYAVMSP